MSKEFQHVISVTSADIDHLGHVNNVVYVRWVQEVAAKHWETIGSPALLQKYLWVVLRHEIDYHNPTYLNDEVIGTTWVGEHHGAKFERFVKLTAAQSGKILAEAKTMWCMLDATTGRPTRIPTEVLDVL